ncbi:MAG: serine/threonine protein kinase [Planctomycetes bacterium]|nr:serine/threonine protein kinase [Planctomycetota bacterium]
MHSQRPAQEPESHSDPTQRVGATVHEPLSAPLPEVGPATSPLVHETHVDSKDAPKAVERTPSALFGQVLLFERYETLGPPIGGGMGLVFKVRDTKLGRIVALKTMKSALLAQPAEVERFLREARAVAQLEHPNIIKLHEYGEHRGEPYFTMEYLEGGSLTSRLAEYTKKDPKELAALMEKVARAVGFAHSKDVIHRDLKPGNILLDQIGEPRVSDFGLAKFLKDGDDINRADQVLGTWYYMSPEQTAGNRDTLTPASDVWSLGVIFYELLTGKKPFNGETKKQITNEVCKKEPLPPSYYRRGLDAGLEAIIEKCVAKDLSKRLEDANEFADQLERWRQGDGISSRGWWKRQVHVAKRHKALAAVVLLAVLLTFLGGYYAVQPSDTERWTRYVQGELRAGRSVTLVGETGGPKWMRWEGGDMVDLPKVEPGEPFAVPCWGLGLLELVPNTGMEAYRLRGEVRQIEAARYRHVGLYFGRHRYATAKGWANVYLTMNFCDSSPLNPKNPEKNLVMILGEMLREPGPLEPSPFYKATPASYRPQIATPKPWRPLAFEVLPDCLRVFWDHKLIHEISWQDLDRDSNRGLSNRIAIGGGDRDELKSISLHFGPLRSEGLGLFVSGSNATFRNVVLEPISQERKE